MASDVTNGRGRTALAMRGSAWSMAGFVAQSVVRVGSNIVLAALLSTATFGLMTLMRVIIQGLELVSDLGIGPSIIQHRRVDRDFLDTAWTMQVVRGVVLWLVCCFAAIPVTLLFEDGRIAWLLPVAGLWVVISGLNSTSLFTLNRKMAFGKLTAVEFTTFVGMPVMIVLAWVYQSVWALVIGWLVGAVAKLVASHVLNRDAPDRVRWDPGAARDLYSFGKWIFLSTLLTFLATQSDRLLLGKLDSLSLLGVYGMAMTVATLPQQIGARLSAFVLYPLLADKARIDRGSLPDDVVRARRLILPAVLVATLGVAVVSPLFFGHLYKEEFADAGWIAPLLTIPCWFALLQVSSDRALLVVGDSRSLSISNGVRFIGSTVGFLVGYWLFGVEGFILGLVPGTLGGHVVVQIALARHGIRIIGQDLLYTAAFAVLGGVSVILPQQMSQLQAADQYVKALSWTMPAVVLLALVLWTLRRLHRAVYAR